MKIPKIADAINNIDEDLVVAAMEDKKKTKRKGIVKWSIAVAASLLIVAAGFFAAGKMGLFDEINAQDSPEIKVVDKGDTVLNTGKDTNSLHDTGDKEPAPINDQTGLNDIATPVTSDDSSYLAAVYKEQTIPQALKAYTLSYPKTPQRPSSPKYTAYDSDGDGRLNEEEQEVFLNSISEWSEFVYKKGMVEEYDQVEAKNELLSFSTKTMTQLLKENDHENRVFSPINIYIALGMLAETTAGNTRQQILDLLGVPSIEDARILMKGLYNNAYYDEDLKSVLASSIWLRDDMNYNQDTMDSLAENYYASSLSGEMGSPEYSEAFRTWLNDQTDGLLKEQIADMKFKKQTIMTLATTVCFCAKWSQEFKKDYTETDVFHAAVGDIQCDFMHQSTTGSYYWGDNFSAIIKWFRPSVGDMMFILPDEGVSVYDLLEDEQVLDFIGKGFEYDRSKNVIINITMPKFDISSKQDIADNLKELGVTDAFDMMNADFSPLTDEVDSIWVDKVEHGVRVVADEDGVKAAAFTVEDEVGGIMPPEEKVDFVLDRPFMFVIRIGDGLPMFIGIVENP